MKKFTERDIAEYIIEGSVSVYEDGFYHVHYNPKTGFNYKGNSDDENITVCARCEYAEGLDPFEFYSKENMDDPDFMRICTELAEKLNQKLHV